MATIEVKCRFCNQADDVKKHGKGSMKHQRYRCNQCNKTFQLDYIYQAFRPGIKAQIVDLAMNNAGIRDTARALHISINAVVRVLKNYPQAVSQPYNSIN